MASAIKGRSGSDAPGFFAKDPATALRERQRLADKADAVFEAEPGDSDDSSSDSDTEWGPRKAERPKVLNAQSGFRELEGVRKSALKSKADEAPKNNISELTAKGLDIAAMAGNLVDPQPMKFENSRAIFENTSFEDQHKDVDKDARSRVSAWSSKHNSRLGHDQVGKRVEPAARRLQRIQAEVEALCAWSEARKAQAEVSKYEPMVVSEAARLGQVSEEVAGLVRRAVAPGGALGTGTASASGAVPPKQLWLPPDDRAHVAGVRQLLEVSRMPASTGAQEMRDDAAGNAGFSYQFETIANNGWLLPADLNALRSLEERVHQLRDVLGPMQADKADCGEDKSLSASVSSLHQRLRILQQVCDDASCDQLQASVQLLSADIDVAAAEAKKLVALEAEERESDIAANLTASNEDTPAMQVSRLHERMAQLDLVASRVSFIESKLQVQEKVSIEFGQFAQDLSSVEARMQHTHDLLKAAQSATERMRQSVQQSRGQFQKNVAALEAKLLAHLAGDSAAAAAAPAAPSPGVTATAKRPGPT